MPKTEVVFYAEKGNSPPVKWMVDLPSKVQDKFYVLIGHLEENGSNLKRPYAAPLRDKIYELRARHQNVNFRLLYFFHKNVAAVLAHGCTKEEAVDDSDIDRAIERRKKFVHDPDAHTYID